MIATRAASLAALVHRDAGQGWLAALERDDPRLIAVDRAGALDDAAPLLLLEPSKGAPELRVRVLAETVGLKTLVVLWEIFSDGKTFLIAEQQSVAILPALHFFARTDPELLPDLLLLVLEEHAGAERPAHLVDVLREADHEEVCDLALGVEVRPRLTGEGLDELLHLRDVLRRGLLAIRLGRLVDCQSESLPSAVATVGCPPGDAHQSRPSAHDEASPLAV